MRAFTLAKWLLIANVGPVKSATQNKTSGVVEVDLVFPRNETYAPTPLFPIVFAFQNSELASLLNAHISFEVWNWNNMSDTVVSTSYDLRWANFSSRDPYFEYRGFSRFNTEGNWMLTWTVSHSSCTEDSFPSLGGDGIIGNVSTSSILFTTKKSAQEVDLVAATNNEKTCSEDLGLAINITDTVKVPAKVDWDGGETCAVVASSPTPTPDPCQVKIDSAVASSISSSMTSRVCTGTDPPVSCPSEDEDEESSAQKLAVGGLTCLAAAIGGLGYIMG